MNRSFRKASPLSRPRVLWTLGFLLLSAMAIQPMGLPSPETTVLLTQALTQLDLALEQAVYAHVRFPLEDLKAHSHIVLNVLEGRSGPDFDPLYDAGDGIGVIQYAQQIRQAPEIEKAKEDPRLTLESALENVLFCLEKTIAHTRSALAQSQLEAAQDEMRQALAFLSAAKGREKELLTAASGLLGIKAKVMEGGEPTTPENK